MAKYSKYSLIHIAKFMRRKQNKNPQTLPHPNSILSNRMLSTGFGISQSVFLEKDGIPNTYFETWFLL